jgi:hypothetical protein
VTFEHRLIVLIAIVLAVAGDEILGLHTLGSRGESPAKLVINGFGLFCVLITVLEMVVYAIEDLVRRKNPDFELFRRP